MAISVVENAVLVGGLSALGAAIYSVGVPKDSVLQYETALKADNFLVMAHGSPAEAAHAKAILGTTKASSVESYAGTKPPQRKDHAAHAAG
jgi:ethanolamine utilization microcompartment shell protein EutL